MVLESLKKAAEDYESISFPAIGTGNLDFKKWEVAKIMMDAVAEFAKQNKRKKLDVYFVVFPKDNDMMKVICLLYWLFGAQHSFSILFNIWFHCNV